MSHPTFESPESPMRIGSDPADKPVDLLAPVTPAEVSAASASPLEQLKAALAAPAAKERLKLRVPTRPGVGLIFDPNFEDTQRKAWRARATKKRRGEDDVDEMLFASLILANTNVAVTFNDVEAHDDEGTPLTFRHKQLWDFVGTSSPQECIKRLFANDPHVLLASGEVMLAAGFDDDLRESSVDPTTATE